MFSEKTFFSTLTKRREFFSAFSPTCENATLFVCEPCGGTFEMALNYQLVFLQNKNKVTGLPTCFQDILALFALERSIFRVLCSATLPFHVAESNTLIHIWLASWTVSSLIFSASLLDPDFCSVCTFSCLPSRDAENAREPSQRNGALWSCPPPSACFYSYLFSCSMGGRGPAHVPRCFWCCQTRFNISKGRHFDEAEGIPAFINESQAINAQMPSCWIIYRFALFFSPSCGPPALWCAPAPAEWRKHLNGSRTCYNSWGRFVFLNMHFDSRCVCRKRIWEQLLIKRVIAVPHQRFMICAEVLRECGWFL